MENLKLVLADGTEIAIDEICLPMHVVISDTQENLLTVWQSLTAENLESVAVISNEETLASMAGAVLDGVQFVQNPGAETYTAHFYLSAAVVSENPEYITAARILLGEVE